MKRSKLIYVMRKYDFAASSQVGELLLHYRDQGIFNEIFLVLSPLGFTQTLNDRLETLRNSGIHVLFYRDVPFLHRRTSFVQIRSIANILKQIAPAKPVSETVIHARSALVTYFALEAQKRLKHLRAIPTLADYRGTEWAEYLLFTHMKMSFVKEIVNPIETSELLAVEKHVYENASSISVVSPDFKNYLSMMWGPRKSVFVNPCIAQGHLFNFDKKLRLNARGQTRIAPNDIVILFSTGGASPWQNITSIISSFHAMRAKFSSLKNSLRLIILTPSAPGLPPGGDAVTIASAAPQEMNRWLNLADVGVIFRDENIVNHVASPIKVSEYLCAGLPILTNCGVPMAVRWVKETTFGAVVDDMADLSEQTLVRLSNINREMIAARGKATYGLSTVAKGYLEAYSTLFTNPESPK